MLLKMVVVFHSKAKTNKRRASFRGLSNGSSITKSDHSMLVVITSDYFTSLSVVRIDPDQAVVITGVGVYVLNSDRAEFLIVSMSCYLEST